MSPVNEDVMAVLLKFCRSVKHMSNSYSVLETLPMRKVAEHPWTLAHPLQSESIVGE